MLVLSRKQGESLRIAGEIRITVVACAGGQVRLAIEAPEDVAVHREEVHERIAAANVEAARASVEGFDALVEGARSPRGEATGASESGSSRRSRPRGSAAGRQGGRARWGEP